VDMWRIGSVGTVVRMLYEDCVHGAAGDFRGGSKRCASALAGEKEAKDGRGGTLRLQVANWPGCRLSKIKVM
jgi:hypothetical protein